MKVMQKYLDSKGKITFDDTNWLYCDEIVYNQELRDKQGNYLFEVFDISDKEWVVFIKLGHSLLKDEYDEALCFEAGLIEVLKLQIEQEQLNGALKNAKK